MEYVNECNSSAVMIACKTLKHFIYFFFFLAAVLSLCSITLRAHILHSIELQHFVITIISYTYYFVPFTFMLIFYLFICIATEEPSLAHFVILFVIQQMIKSCLCCCLFVFHISCFYWFLFFQQEPEYNLKTTNDPYTSHTHRQPDCSHLFKLVYALTGE